MPVILVDAQELGRHLKRSPATILSWARQDKIPSIKGGTGRVLFDLDQVLDALRKKQAKAGLHVAS